MTTNERVIAELRARKKNAENAYRAAVDELRRDEKIDALYRENAALKWDFVKERSAEKRDALQKAIDENEIALDQAVSAKGVLESAFSVPYTCKICNDTGVTADGKRCACFDALRLRIQERDNPLLAPYPVGLEKVDYAFYGEDEGKKRADATSIEKALKEGRKYFLFAGKTGTGKTYFAGALVKKLMAEGKEVFCETATKFNKLLLEYHCAPLERKREIWRSFGDADVLLVDDLGAEQILNNVTVPYLTEILSERTEKITIFTTNVTDVAELERRYGQRVVSRLFDKKLSFPVRFGGADRRFNG